MVNVLSCNYTKTWIYLIQLSSVTGPWGISFIVVTINVLISLAIIKKKIKYLIVSGIIFTANLIYGFIAVQSNTSSLFNPEFKAAIITENISAETRWQKENGDSLASILINLNVEAAKSNPNLIVWTETALPWRFSPDDDLIKIALSKTQNTRATHLIGILTTAPAKPGFVYNSVYSIEYDGRITSIYNKNELLSLLEKPLFETDLFNSMLPFFANIGYRNALPGTSYKPAYTSVGKAGILICNESILPICARVTSDEGAEFLVNMSNDAWFENMFLLKQHFYTARMRAVENRRDIIVNSNRGITGIVDSKGNIVSQKQSKLPGLLTGKIEIRHDKTIYTKYGDWLIYCSFLIIIVGGRKLYFTKKR